ncbi:MAG: Fic family protein [Clostridia bacterium]|nr:Fic family protein [Clostridia bacterium]
MPIIKDNGQGRLNDADIRALKEMLKGSLESHIIQFRDEYPKYARTNIDKSQSIFLAEFQKALDTLDERVDKAVKSGSSVTAVDFMQNFFDDLGRDIVIAISDADLENREYSYALDFTVDFGNKIVTIDFLNRRLTDADKDEGYEKTDSAFKLADEPLPGIEEIGSYNPNNTSVGVLYDARSGNSGTLENKVEDRLKDLNDPKNQLPEQQEQLKARLNDAVKSTGGLHVVGETSRIFSTELMNKDNITFGDLYDVFSGLNKAARQGDDKGGKLRGEGITAGRVNGVGTFNAPRDLYKTLSKVADLMNRIKKTENEALRKTQAIQVANYAYFMTLSEHVFGDGNGRTCRMFADTILQTFGLPPHTPMPEIQNELKTIGTDPMDFNKGTEIFFKGIKESDKLLKAEQNRINSIPDAAKRQDHKVTSLENNVRLIAQEAGEKLKALEGMQKKGHKNGPEYQAMYDALKKASKLDPSTDSISYVEKALEDIDSTSKEYQRTHTGWFKATSGFGADRMKLAQENQKFASFRKDVFKGFAGDFSKYTVIGALHPDLSAQPKAQVQAEVSAPAQPQVQAEVSAPAQVQDKKVKNVSLSDLEKLDNKSAKQNDAPKKRRNTIAGSKKEKEISKGQLL